MAKKKTLWLQNGNDIPICDKEVTNNGMVQLNDATSKEESIQQPKCKTSNDTLTCSDDKRSTGQQPAYSVWLCWLLFFCVCVTSFVTRLHKIEEPAHVW